MTREMRDTDSIESIGTDNVQCSLRVVVNDQKTISVYAIARETVSVLSHIPLRGQARGRRVESRFNGSYQIQNQYPMRG